MPDRSRNEPVILRRRLEHQRKNVQDTQFQVDDGLPETNFSIAEKWEMAHLLAHILSSDKKAGMLV